MYYFIYIKMQERFIKIQLNLISKCYLKFLIPNQDNDLALGISRCNGVLWKLDTSVRMCCRTSESVLDLCCVCGPCKH